MVDSDRSWGLNSRRDDGEPPEEFTATGELKTVALEEADGGVDR